MIKLVKSDLREINHDNDPAHIVGCAVHILCGQIKYVRDLAKKYPEHMLGEAPALSEQLLEFAEIYSSVAVRAIR